MSFDINLVEDSESNSLYCCGLFFFDRYGHAWTRANTVQSRRPGPDQGEGLHKTLILIDVTDMY